MNNKRKEKKRAGGGVIEMEDGAGFFVGGCGGEGRGV